MGSGNVADLLRSAAAAYGEHDAVISSAVTRTWAGLDHAVDLGVGVLQEAGLEPGARIIVSLQTGADAVAAMFAVARAGLVAVPIGPSRMDLDGIAAKVGAHGLIGDQPDTGIGVVLTSADVSRWWTERPSEGAGRAGKLTHGNSAEDDPAEDNPADGDPAEDDPADGDPAEDDPAEDNPADGDPAEDDPAEDNPADDNPADGDPAEDDPAEDTPQGVRTGGEDLAVLARAASAVRPVMVSHRAILAAVEAIGLAPGLDLRQSDRALMVLPIYHLAGWVTVFLPLCRSGGAAVVPDLPAAGETWIGRVLDAVRRQRVTVIPAAPSLYRRLRQATGVERALASVRLMTSGAAPLESEDVIAIKTITGQSVWEGYGIAESASAVSSSLMTAAPRPGSVGLPLPGIELRLLVDAGSRSDLEYDGAMAEVGDDGEVGQILVKGPTLFSGYWPDGSGGAGKDGWFATGDVGYLDDRGELHLVDRSAETINMAGFTVYPREIEEVLTGHPYIRDAAVVGVPGAAGSMVVAVLVAQWGKHPTESDLDEYVASRLPVFKRPLRYRLVDRLPRTEVGRVDRALVRARYLVDAIPDLHWNNQEGSGAVDTEQPHVGNVASAEDVQTAANADPAANAELAANAEPAANADPAEQAAGDGEPVAARSAHLQPQDAGELSELGARLPGTGERVDRGARDTDDDLF